jgi:hypothetical protein
MKKLLLTFTIVVSSLTAKAGIGDWFHFEPLMLCAAGAGGGYAATTVDKDKNQNAAIGCAVGALIGYGINYYYDDKFGAKYQKDIKDQARMIQDMQWSMATKVEKGLDEDHDGVIIVEQVVPAQQTPNGEIIMPTKRKKIVIPGEGARFGQ